MNTDVVIKLRKNFQKPLADSIRKKTLPRLKPSNQIMRSFYAFAARAAKYALKDQLLTAEGTGYASGQLFESIEVTAGHPNSGNWSRGIKWVDIDFKVSMARGGKHIAEGTNDIPNIRKIVSWIEHKQATGTLRAMLLDETDVWHFATNILSLWEENRSIPATYPNWYSFSKNLLLARDFDRYFNEGKSYHIGRITEDIKRKIEAK